MDNNIITEYSVAPLGSLPGIQRDGTIFDCDNYIDGQHCRFYKGKPKKIGGYSLIEPGTTEIIRNMCTVPRQGSIDCYLGRPSTIAAFNILNAGQGIQAEFDRTPANGFVASPNNQWTFDFYTDLTGPTRYIIAHAAQNCLDIDNNTEARIFWGATSLATPLTSIAGSNPSCSGGILVVYPYVFKYGNDGVVTWTLTPTNWAAAKSAAIAGTKIVKAGRIKGSGSALFWSLTSLSRMTRVGGATEFAFETIQDDLSIIASNSVVTQNGLYYWIGREQFYVTDGNRVEAIPNDLNRDYFFNNLNFAYANKIAGVVLKEYSEIWWFWPKGNATENTDVLIYNYKDNVWFDSVLARSAAVSPTSTFEYPLMAESVSLLNKNAPWTNPPTNTIPNYTYGIWLHEIGTDKVLFGESLAIPSYFETNVITLFKDNGQLNRQLRIRRLEQDFVQAGDMSVVIKTWPFAQGTPVLSSPYIFSPGPQPMEEAKIDAITMGREVSFRFESNVQGGNYFMGNVLLDYKIGDVTP